ncbi:Hypothetical predicted protein, partial [Marmota monax]
IPEGSDLLPVAEIPGSNSIPSPKRLIAQELRDLCDLISFQCQEPTLQPRAELEALKDAHYAGTPRLSAGCRRPPTPSRHSKSPHPRQTLPCFARPQRAKHFCSRAKCASFEEAPVNKNTKTQAAARLTKRTLPAHPATQNPDNAGKDSTYG